MWCICTMEYYSAITKTKWTQLENIMLNEISQTQKEKKKAVCFSTAANSLVKFLYLCQNSH